MLSSSKDCSLKIWDLREGRLLFTLLGHSGPVNAAKFSADGHFFASGGADQLVMIWKSNFFGVDAPVIEWGQGQAGQNSKVRVPAAAHQQSSSSVNNSIDRSAVASVGTGARPPTADTSRARISKNSSRGAGKHVNNGSDSRNNTSTLNSSTVSRRPDFPRSQTAPTAAGPPASTTTTVGPRATPANAVRAAASASAEVASVKDALPAALSATLEHIVGQLDIITKTMSIMDERLTLTENRVSAMISAQRGVSSAAQIMSGAAQQQQQNQQQNQQQHTAPEFTMQSRVSAGQQAAAAAAAVVIPPAVSRFREANSDLHSLNSSGSCSGSDSDSDSGGDSMDPNDPMNIYDAGRFDDDDAAYAEDVSDNDSD